MRKFKYLLYADLALSLILLMTILVWKIVLQHSSLGYIVISLVTLLAINAALCTFSVAGIKRGRQQLIAKLWLLVISLVFFYFALDVAGSFILTKKSPFRNSPDEYVHHRMLPNTHYRMRDPNGDFDVEMTTNSRGFRGKDIPDKKPDTYRIVMLGDSFTMGEGVDYKNTFPYLTEENLNKSGTKKYEVINLGVESYAPLLEYLLLKENIDFLKPDLVILNFDMGDILDEYAYRETAIRDATGDIIAVNGFAEYRKTKELLYARIFDWINRHLFITGSIVDLINTHIEQNNAAKNLNVVNVIEKKNSLLLLHTLKAPQLENAQEMYSFVEDSILRTRDLCDRHGSKFILSIYPLGHQVNDKEWVPGRYTYIPQGAEISDRTIEELAGFSKKNGIAFFNPFPDFRGYKGSELLYYKHNGHWTPIGQHLMADSISKFIEYFLNNGT